MRKSRRKKEERTDEDMYTHCDENKTYLDRCGHAQCADNNQIFS